MQPSTLTYPIDHTVLESRVKVHRLFPFRDLRISINIDYKIKVEILNTQINRSRSQITYGEGETPLNRKGILLFYFLERMKK